MKILMEKMNKFIEQSRTLTTQIKLLLGKVILIYLDSPSRYILENLTGLKLNSQANAKLSGLLGKI